MEQVAEAPLRAAAPTHSRSETIAFLIMAAILIIAPFFTYPLFLMQVMCFALFACAFNLLIGYVGLLSFGHALYFGWASYVCAHAAKVWGLTPELAIIAGTLTAAGLGLVAGMLAIRRQGIYFAMITLALAQMMYFFALQAKFTGGEDGIQGVPRRPMLGFLDIANDVNFYYVVLAIFLAGFLLIYRIIHSPFGEVLKAIRENEARARYLGYDVENYKLFIFCFSAGVAGLAGMLFTLTAEFASPSLMATSFSISMVIWAATGGRASLLGACIGALIVNFVGSVASESVTFQPVWPIVLGGLFVFVVLVMPNGLAGIVKDWIARSGKTRAVGQEVYP
ncbi:MAG: branched-chain amino acid ABC transporter permease [Pseudolabrys sp.]|nr:branched-chain amino acid ABC transporter permease [Pseudolabrys sp.]